MTGDAACILALGRLLPFGFWNGGVVAHWPPPNRMEPGWNGSRRNEQQRTEKPSKTARSVAPTGVEPVACGLGTYFSGGTLSEPKQHESLRIAASACRAFPAVPPFRMDPGWSKTKPWQTGLAVGLAVHCAAQGRPQGLLHRAHGRPPALPHCAPVVDEAAEGELALFNRDPAPTSSAATMTGSVPAPCSRSTPWATSSIT